MSNNHNSILRLQQKQCFQKLYYGNTITTFDKMHCNAFKSIAKRILNKAWTTRKRCWEKADLQKLLALNSIICNKNPFHDCTFGRKKWAMIAFQAMAGQVAENFEICTTIRFHWTYNIFVVLHCIFLASSSIFSVGIHTDINVYFNFWYIPQTSVHQNMKCYQLKTVSTLKSCDVKFYK